MQRSPEPASSPECIRSDRALALAGLVLVALNLRAAVVALPPVYDQVARSFPVSTAAQGVIGTLPLLCFALFGMAAPAAARRFGLEKSLVVAMAMVGAGEFARAWVSGSAMTLGLFSIMCLGGIGMGNVLLPPVITRYFPDRTGSIGAVFQVTIVAGASLPSLVAVPVAAAAGWRVSVGMWGILGLVAMVPWIRLVRRRSVPPTKARAVARAWRWPTAWAIMLVFASGPTVMYALIAWLPTILVDTAGVDHATAGTMLSVYSGIGLFHSLLIPIVLTRMRRPYGVVVFAVTCLCGGVLGLIHAPHAPWVWIVLGGLGPMLMNIGLTLLNMRSRTEAGATALSGFVQSVGYLVAGIGPLTVGLLHGATGSWTAGLWFLAGVGMVAALAGLAAFRPVWIEDMDATTDPMTRRPCAPAERQQEASR